MFLKLCVPANVENLRTLVSIDEVLFAINSETMDAQLRARYAQIMQSLYVGSV